MAEAAVAAPPAAPVAPAAPAAPAAPMKGGGEPITVTPAAVDKGPPQAPPKAGSAREQMFKDLRKKAGVEETPETKAPEPKSDTSPSDETKETAPTGESAPEKKGKVSPWKLMEEHKAARLKAEAEIAELRKSVPNPEEQKRVAAEVEAIRKRNQELEEHIRFTDYSKSKEFAEKYQKPYEDSWKRWMGELGELTVDEGGQERPIQPQDLLELVNLPLGKARERAETLFGPFANDVMSARKEIRGLFDAQNNALEEARKNGAARDAERMNQIKAMRDKVSEEVRTSWKEFNESVVADEKVGKYFKTVEGDDEANNRLKQGFEIADRAFSVNSLDPRLTPEQRKEAVRLHSAVRNRAAVFGKLVYQLEKSHATIEELKAELAKYKGAQPGAGTAHPEASQAPHSAKEEVFGALRKIAH